MKVLKDWLPHEFQQEFMDTSTAKYLDWEVIEEYSINDDKPKSPPFSHKNIYNWCIVKRDKKYRAIAWNESPVIGWSFPNKKVKRIEV